MQLNFLLRIMLFIAALPAFGIAQTTYNFIGQSYGTFGNENLWENGIEPPSGVQNAIINIQVACNFDIGFEIGAGTVMNVNANYFQTSLNAFIINNGILNVNGGNGFPDEMFTINSSGYLTNNSVINVNRLLTCWGGVLNNNSSGVINLATSINLEVRSIGTFNNAGSLVLHPGSLFSQRGTMNHTGSVTVNNSTFNNTGNLTATTGTISILTGGLFSANGTTNLNGTSQLSNEGFLNCTAGTFTHSANATLINNGSLTHSGGIFNSQGFFRGSGIFNGNLFNSGMVSPGTTTPATMTITGSFFPSGTVNIEVGSTTDVFAITGNAVLGGTLTVNTVSGYLPPAGACGQSFDILTCAALSGTFSSVNLPTGWKIEYLSTGVRLEVDPAFNTFTGAGLDQFWSNPANWLGCEVPMGTVNYPINIAAPCIMDLDITVNNSLTVDTMQSLNVEMNQILTIQPGKTLTNRGELAGIGAVVNHGNILNTHSVLAFDLNNTGSINNFKTLLCTFASGIDNTGTILNQPSGTISGNTWTNAPTGIVINQGTIQNGTNMSNLGLVKGNGQILASWVNNGTLEPGLNAVGTTTIDGGYDQAATATLKIEIGGTGAGQFDQLIVSNVAILAGNVHITLVNGFVPTNCSEYPIVTAIACTGTLTVVNQPASDWEVIIGVGGAKLRYSGTLTSHTFIGGGNTLWSNNNNWLECVAPPDNVVLPVVINGSCWIDRDVVINNSLTVNTTRDLQINSGKSLTIAAGQNFVNYGHVTNYGLFELWGTFTNNHIFAAPDGSTNDLKAGSVFNANTTTTSWSGISNMVNGTLNIGSTGAIGSYTNTTIGATGVLNIDNFWIVFSGTLTNMGTINVNAGQELLLFTGATITNTQVIHNNGLIDIPLNSTLNNQGTLNNAGLIQNQGTVNNQAAATLVCDGTFEQNGNFQNAGTFSGIGSITPAAVWTNNGTIAPGGSPGTLSIAGAAQLGAGSVLDMGIWSGTQFDVLSVTGNITLSGSLNLSVYYTPAVCTEFTLLNAGTVSGNFSTFNAPNGWALEVGSTYVKVIYGGTPATTTFTNASGDGLWTNRLNWDNCVLPYSAIGSNNVQIVIASNCTLNTQFTLSTQLTINPVTTLTIVAPYSFTTQTSSAITVLGNLWIQGEFEHNGTLKGTGTVTGNLYNNGHVQPGTSPGTLTITGEYEQDLTAYLDIEVNGTNPGEFDRLNISGDANLSGILQVAVMLPFPPSNCIDWVILQAGSVSGTFNQVILPNNINWTIRYTPTQVIIRYVPGNVRNFVGGGGNALWSNDANWQECAAPPDGYDFPINILAPCTLDIDYALNANMTNSAAAPFTIQNGVVFQVLAGSQLNFYSLTNYGTMNVAGDMNMNNSSDPALVNNGTLGVNVTTDLTYYRSISNTGNLSINAPSLTLYSTIASTGAGNLDITVNQFVNLAFPNSGLSTVDGNIQIDANTSGTGSGVFVGIDISTFVSSSGQGDITLNGHGGNQLSSNLSGIRLSNSAKVECTGSGAITLTGHAGDDSGFFSNSAGITVDGNAEIKTNTGTVSLTGNGGNGGSSQYGILLYPNGKISSVASTADITLMATGGTGQGFSNPNIGLYLSGSISTGDADLTINAAAGLGNTNGSYGMYVNNGVAQCTGSGDLNISASGGTSGDFNHGIYMTNLGQIKGKTGPVMLTATAGAGNSDGIRMENAGGVHTGSGSIMVSGVGSGFGSGINFESGGIIGGDTTSGPITLITDTYRGGFVRGTGQLNIRPFTPATTIGIGFGNPGTLHFDNTEVNNFQNGFSRIILGDPNNGTGLLTANGLFFQDPLTLAAGSIAISGINANEGQMQLIARTGNVRDLDNGGFDVDCADLSISTPNGALAPGNSPGLFRIDGNYTHTGNYEVEIVGVGGAGSSNGHDQLQVQETLNLGGTLTVKFINGFVPNTNDQFVLAYANALNGIFSTINFEPSNISCTIQYINNQVILSNVVVLPVALIEFKAIPVEKTVQLDWATASETNNKGFFVERSENGQYWQDLGFVPGKGNSQSVQYYRFEDKQPILGLQYYRLRQVDTDGTYLYSNIEQVVMQEAGQPKAWPNPTRGYLQLEWADNVTGQLRLFDLQGRVVLEQAMDDVLRLTLDLNGLPVGVYQLVMWTEAGVGVERVVLSK